MIGEHLQGHLVLLLTPPNLVIKLGVVQGQATVHSKGTERFLVLLHGDGQDGLGGDLGEHPVALLLVHHLDDAYDGAADADGHAEDRLGHVAGLLVDARVEPLVHVDVRHVEGLACARHVASDPLPDREPVESVIMPPGMWFQFLVTDLRGFKVFIGHTKIVLKFMIFIYIGVYC